MVALVMVLLVFLQEFRVWVMRCFNLLLLLWMLLL